MLHILLWCPGRGVSQRYGGVLHRREELFMIPAVSARGAADDDVVLVRWRRERPTRAARSTTSRPSCIPKHPKVASEPSISPGCALPLTVRGQAQGGSPSRCGSPLARWRVSWEADAGARTGEDRGGIGGMGGRDLGFWSGRETRNYTPQRPCPVTLKKIGWCA